MFEAVPLLILFILYIVASIDKLFRQKKLFYRVSWCVATANQIGKETLFSDEIYSDLYNPFLFDLIPENYRIDFHNEEERNFVSIIAAAYRLHLSQTYFRKKLCLNLDLLRLTEHQYFMASLHSFLVERMYFHKFEGMQMLQHINTEYHGNYPASWCVDTYALTDFAITYYKLLYATEVFIENTDHKVKAFRGSLKTAQRTKNYLDAKIIKLECIQ